MRPRRCRCLYREALAKAGAIEGLFNQFGNYLKAKRFLAMGG
jgi:transposase, IS5 family